MGKNHNLLQSSHVVDLGIPKSEKIDAKCVLLDSYGQTPLHMAAKNGCSETAKLLLYRGASVEAKANDGKSPLDHVSAGPGSQMLPELLNWYLEEQRKRKAVEACSETKAKMEELERELSNIVGLHDLKLQLRKWARGMMLDERRRALGLEVAA
ncbi:hypothetical protein Ancab_016800 [Ancistrocladus abbreviatus]